MRLRFAPSPTGQLHVGNARTALFNWLLARGDGARSSCASRTPTSSDRRKRPSDAILEDLRWLGLELGRGVEAGGAHGPYRQSERLHIYRAHAVELMSRGQAYHCFCSEEQLETDRTRRCAAGSRRSTSAAAANISREDARRRIENGEQAVVRFRVPDGDREIAFDDLVRGRVCVFEPTSSAIPCSCAPTAFPPTTSPSSSTMR